MRFEVNVDDGAGLATLHKARDAWNLQHPEAAAADMPSFVQRLMDSAVAQALEGCGAPTTLSAALSKIADLESQNTTLTQEVKALSPAQVEQVKPA